MNKLMPCDIKLGQTVQLNCDYLKSIFRYNDGIMVGKVVSLFFINDNDYQVEIINPTSRFRWDSRRDGGYLSEVSGEKRKSS